MEPFCAAVDWGTSSLRIWLMSPLGNPMITRKTDEGAIIARQVGFRTILDQYLETFSVEPDLPVIICGMAGARDGWQEADYLNLPQSINHITRFSAVVPHKCRDVRILPGLAQRNMLNPDTMRGEETQLFGLVDKLPNRSIICIPGTHSKWVHYQEGRVDSLSTFVTGELYGLLKNHSTLGSEPEEHQRIDPASPTFLRSVTDAFNNPQDGTHLLFSIRASNLLGYSSVDTNNASISGTLIGLELAGAFAKFGAPEEVILVASGKQADLYQSALIALRARIRLFDANEAAMSGLFKAAKILWPQR